MARFIDVHQDAYGVEPIRTCGDAQVTTLPERLLKRAVWVERGPRPSPCPTTRRHRHVTVLRSPDR